MNDNDLIRIETALAAGLPVPNDLAARLLDGLAKFKQGQCKTLCNALGLRRVGLSSFSTRQILAERDARMNDIARIHNGGALMPGDKWRVACDIADRIKRYPRINSVEKPLYAVLFNLNCRLPGSPQGVYKLLKLTN